MKLLVSTGCYFRIMRNTDNIIKRILKHDVNGYELSLLDYKSFKEYKPSEAVIRLSQKYYNTIHAPAKNIVYQDNSRTRKVINKLKMLTTQIRSNNITLHHDTIKDKDYVFKSLRNYKISVENLEKDSNLEKILNNYSSLDLTLDICHAMNSGTKKLVNIIKKYNQRISEIHWSYTGKNYSHDSPAIKLKEIHTLKEIVKKTGKPVIIEVDLRKDGEYSNVISQEIKLLKEYY